MANRDSVVDGVAVGVAIDHHTRAALTAEELVNRETSNLALNVPEGLMRQRRISAEKRTGWQ